jgi:hypothetical protein
MNNIKLLYNNKNINVSIEDDKQLWIHNNVFEVIYDNNNIKIIVDNDSKIWLEDNVCKILEYNIKDKYKKKFNNITDNIKYISEDIIRKIIIKCNNIKFKKWLDNDIIPNLNKNKSCLFDNNIIKKTYNFVINSKLII